LGATDRPLFRTDLVSRPVESAGQRFIEVTDPDSGRSFRFYEVEYAIACAMDGERDLYGLADWARIELGLEPSHDELRTVVGTLGDLGYLETGAGAMAEPPPLDRPPPVGRAGVSPFDLPVAAGGPGLGGPPPLSPGLSTDLSDHIPVRAADVKEAVRQSRVMQALRGADHDHPPPMEDDFDEQATPAPMRPMVRPPAAAAMGQGLPGQGLPGQGLPGQGLPGQGLPGQGLPGQGLPGMPPGPGPGPGGNDLGQLPGRQPPPGTNPALGKTLLGTPAPPRGAGAGRSSTPAPMVLPEQPGEFSAGPGAPFPAGRMPGPSTPAPMHQVGRGPVRGAHEIAVPPPRRQGGLMPYLLVLLLLSVAGAGVYWWVFLRDSEPTTGAPAAPPPASAPSPVEQTPPPPEQPAAAQPAPPPAEPAEIVAALEAGPTQEREVVSTVAGRVAWVAPPEGEVSEGAPVAKLAGYTAWEYKVKEAQDSQRGYQEKLDQATSRGDKDAMKEAEGNVKRKQNDIERHQGELDKFLIKAPAGGVVELSIKKGDVVKRDQTVAKILAQSEPRAVFALPPGFKHEGGEVSVASRTDPTLAATCKVESSDPAKLVVSCPTDSGLASGTQVVLKPN
jgi:hypothetical protein